MNGDGGETPSGGRRRRWKRTAARTALAVILVWALAAYLILPDALRLYERRARLDGFEMVTRTAQGLPGDPLNVGIVGSRADLVAAMTKAGWSPADPVTWRTGIEIVGSVVLDRPYPQAPVSPLFYQGRQQDLAFEKPVGTSADRREHVRFWDVSASGGDGGRPLWLGSASFDVGVGISHYTGAVTHAIDPDVDRMRDALTDDLAGTGLVRESYEVAGVGPTVSGRNGEGDRYVTDGALRVSVLAASAP